MSEVFTKWVRQLKEFWQSLDKSQKKRIYITSAIVIITVTIGTVVLTRPVYTTLISNSTQKETGEMSGILTENNIWHDVKDNGTCIIVNTKDNCKAQMVLAQKGYPKGGMTFEDAVKMIGITTTESDKKHIWKQQQANEIAKKLMAHDNVEYAEVSLALPEQSVFLTSERKEYTPTAYVMVKPVSTLSQEQVEGIVMMVSKSVEKLDPKDVTVVDNNLNVLNSHVKDNVISTVNSQEEMRAKKARELEEKVYNYFSVGQFDSFDTLRVVANPFLDFDKIKTQSKIINNPSGMDQGAVISSEEITEKSENLSRGGVPGTDTNPGETTSPGYLLGDDGESSYSLKENKRNYGYDETLKEEEKAIGSMIAERSSMAISLWYGRRVQDESKLSEELINQVRIAASTATGIPVENISVNKYKLAPPESTKLRTTDKIRELVNDYGLFMLLVVMMFGIVFSILLAKKRTEEMELAAVGTTASVSAFMEPEHVSESIHEIDLDEKSEIQKQIDKFAKEKPETVAQLLRSWLSDSWDM
jgi:flagellar M-ring protein FliF